MPHPHTHRGTVVDTYHGTEVADPYRWLESPDSDDTQAWVAAQNAVTNEFLAASPGRKWIKDRLTHLWNYGRVGVPVKKGDTYFFMKNDGLQDQAILYVTDDLNGDERVLLDPNDLSKDGTISLGEWFVSDDGRYLAWSTSDGGSDWRTWRIRHVRTGTDLDDVLRWSKFSTAGWTPDNRGFFYSRYDAPDDPLEQVNANQSLHYHRLGTSQTEDTLVYARPDEPTWGFNGLVTDDGDLGLVSVWRSTEPKNLLYTLDPRRGLNEPAPLIETWDAQYLPIGKRGRTLYLQTDLDAPRNRVIAIDLDNPGREHWRQVIPEGEHLLESASIIGDTLFLTRLVDAKNHIETADLAGNITGSVALPSIGAAGGFHSHPDATEAFYWFTSFTRPTTIFRYDLTTGKSEPFRAPQVDIDPNIYVTEQVFATSKDGTRVPIFLSYRKDMERKGNSPTVLYGYGGFNISITPAFSVKNVVWMDMGGVWASTNLRGGGEYGRDWHEAGTKERKQNVFDDFIACAEWLIDHNWTTPERMAIQGRSNGGLLVGATLLQRPDLFGAALPGVGVLDMLRYHHFTIGWAWASDYGTSDDAEMFCTLMTYSPVHNASPGSYPATMVMTADHDDRVVPAHSYKFAAALQNGQQSEAPILIRIETRAGHGAGKSLSMVIDEATDEKAFLVRALNIEMDAVLSH